MKILRNKFQQQFLWENIIVEFFEQESKHFSSYWNLAKVALDAWYILNIKNISLIELEKYCCNLETEYFVKWAKKYQSILKQYNYVDQIFKLNDISYPGSNLNNKPDCFKIACTDFRQELSMAATFAKNKSLDHDNNSKIAIVILNLEQVRSEVEYVFNNFLDEKLYSILLPVKLNSSSLINICLLILHIANCYLNNKNIKYEDFSKLLRTKFIVGFNIEHSYRFYLDYKLRKIVDYEFNWQYIISQLQLNNVNCNIFIKVLCDFEQELQQLINNNKNQKFKQNCDGWVCFTNKILSIFGITLESLLEEYLTLVDFLKEHDLVKFIAILTKLSQEINIETQNDYNKKINIVDLDIALKRRFDDIWILGVSDLEWPNFNQTYKVNFFIPKALQQSNNSGIEVLRQLINQANKTVICSYPLYIDNNKVKHSTLIAGFTDFNNKIDKSEKTNKNIILEYYEDNMAPPYNKKLFSGVKFLKSQIACPFQANAKTRLHADELKVPHNHVDSIMKGEILHQTMEHFWGKYLDINAVKNLSVKDLYNILIIVANNVLYNLSKLKPTTLHPQIIKLEAKRIAKLCCNFIVKHDLVRPDFAILYLEKKFIVKLKELLIKIKIDRIDQLLDNNLIIIDYKTGKLVNTDYNDDPQLLIYSLCLPNVKELMWAIINYEPKFINIPSWQESKDIWYENLYKIAKDFENGVAIVNPKYEQTTCRTCDLKYFCRIFEKH